MTTYLFAYCYTLITNEFGVRYFISKASVPARISPDNLGIGMASTGRVPGTSSKRRIFSVFERLKGSRANEGVAQALNSLTQQQGVPRSSRSLRRAGIPAGGSIGFSETRSRHLIPKRNLFPAHVHLYGIGFIEEIVAISAPAPLPRLAKPARRGAPPAFGLGSFAPPDSRGGCPYMNPFRVLWDFIPASQMRGHPSG